MQHFQWKLPYSNLYTIMLSSQGFGVITVAALYVDRFHESLEYSPSLLSDLFEKLTACHPPPHTLASAHTHTHFPWDPLPFHQLCHYCRPWGIAQILCAGKGSKKTKRERSSIPHHKPLSALPPPSPLPMCPLPCLLSPPCWSACLPVSQECLHMTNGDLGDVFMSGKGQEGWRVH